MTDHNVPNDDDQHRKSSPLLRHSFDPESDSVNAELVRAVAALDDTDPIELDVLADVIDPEALDDLFRHHVGGLPRDTDGEVRFEYNGHRVRITADGIIAIDPPESASDD